MKRDYSVKDLRVKYSWISRWHFCHGHALRVSPPEDSKEVKYDEYSFFCHILVFLMIVMTESLGVTVCRDVVLDGLLACDSGPCVELVTHLAAELPSPLSSTRLSSWLAGVHLQSHTDPSSITQIMVC